MDNFGLIDLHGRKVLPCQYWYLDEPSCGLLLCRKAEGDKDGYINPKGKFVIPPKFQHAGPFDRATGLATVWETRDGLDYYGLINTSGEYVLKPVYAGVYQPSEGLVAYNSYAHHELFGYADLRGNVVLQPRYKYATPFSCGLALVTYPDDLKRSFFIDRTGRHVLGPYGVQASEKYAFSGEGIAMVCDPGQKKQHYYIDPTGQSLLKPPRGVLMGEFRGGLSQAYDQRLKKFGFVDISGQWAIKPQYDATLGFIQGFACVAVGGELRQVPTGVEVVGERWGLIDTQGREVVSLKYKSSGQVGKPSCGRILFGESSGGAGSPLRFGYLSTLTGKVAITAKFTWGGPFSEGFATVTEE